MRRFLRILTVFTLLSLVTLALAGCGIEPPEAPPAPKAPIITTHPATLAQCPTGGLEILSDDKPIGVTCNGSTGLSGAIGPQGNQGVQGNQGIPGVNITPITVVQFCPGQTVYPAAFLEIGFCISGNLYAVYSVPLAFMTLIAPGHYLSVGVGSSCNFDVLPNCVVQ